MQCIDTAWHPEIATQLVLASEDDHAPVIQLWDLRFATSPMKVEHLYYDVIGVVCYRLLFSNWRLSFQNKILNTS